MSQIPINNNPTPPKRGERVLAKDIAELWQSVKRLAARQDQIQLKVFPNPKLAPLAVTLRRIAGSPETWEVFAQFGHVVRRHNASSETGEPLEIADLPEEDTPLEVIEDTKLWVKLTVDAYGKVTAADWESDTTWPDDSPPSLIGGNDQSGTQGYRYIRIAEIIANPDTTTTPPQLMVDQMHTGHIDHFQPEICENTITSPGTSEARSYKTWNASSGRHDFRYLKGSCGTKVTEYTDYIELKPDGNTFKVRLWKPTLTVNPFTFAVIVTQPSTPEKEFWILNGVWYTSEPSNWTTCGGSGVTTYNFSYIAPAGGGS